MSVSKDYKCKRKKYNLLKIHRNEAFNYDDTNTDFN